MAQARRWVPLALVLFGVGWGANQFAPLLLVYRDTLGLSESARAAVFGVYAAGLVPGLLLGGPASDRLGRRAVVLPGALLSLVAGAALVLGAFGIGGLYAGRFLAGVVSGVVFSAGGAWMAELSAGQPPGTGARRAAIAMTAGFGGGPLVAGAVAQWLPAPDVLPYLVHLAVMAAVLPALRGVPETAPAAAESGTAEAGERRPPLVRLRVPPGSRRAFWLAMVPMAPWVFALATIAFAVLPARVGDLGGLAIAFTGAITALTATAGVLVQPLGRRMGVVPGAVTGLGLGAAGVALAALADARGAAGLLVPVALILGCAYGLCLTAGLRMVDVLAAPEERGALTGLYYALTYVGFAAPYLLAAAATVADGATALLAAAALATLTAAWVALRGGPALAAAAARP